MARHHKAEGGPPAIGSSQAFLDAYEIDHKSGKTYDGHISNLQAMCRPCNFAKGRIEAGGYSNWKENCRWCSTTQTVLSRDGQPLSKHLPGQP